MAKARFIGIIFTVVLAAASLSFAIGSKEKSPEEQAQDDSRKAVENYNSGVKHMEKAKEIVAKGDSASAYNYRATSDAKARKEYEKAIGDFKNAIELKPEMKEAHNNLGYCYRKTGKLPESLTAYEKAIALDSNFAEAREYRAETYLALGKLDLAQQELAWLKGHNPTYAEVLGKAIELYQLEKIKETSAGNGH